MDESSVKNIHISKIISPGITAPYTLQYINNMLYENREMEMSITIDKIFNISCYYSEELFLVNNIATSREQLEEVYNLTIEMVDKLFDRIVLDRFVMINKKEEILTETDYHSCSQPIKEEFNKYIFTARSIGDEICPPYLKNYDFILIDGYIKTDIYTNNIAFNEYIKSVKIKNTITRN